MADRAFIQKQLKKLETNFGKERFKVTQPVFELWADMFKDLDNKGMEASVDEYISTNEYPPTVASIMKIYNAKKQERESLREFLRGKYILMCRWYEEPWDDAIHKKIVNYITTIPQESRKQALTEMAIEAIEFYQDCKENGEPTSINKFLGGYLWTQKDN